MSNGRVIIDVTPFSSMKSMKRVSWKAHGKELFFLRKSGSVCMELGKHLVWGSS